MQITLKELFTQIDAAKARMSPRNSHRVLFDQCQRVIWQMATERATVQPMVYADEPASTPAAVEPVEPSRLKDADGSPENRA